MKRFFFVLLLSGTFLAKGQIILEDAAQAFVISAESKKPVLLIFSGSDWCAPCIRFNKEVLTTEQFQYYASDHFVLLKADFPQRKKLDKALVEQNEKLADRYNPTGQFPHILLLHPEQSVLATLHYKNQNPEEFISQLSTYFAE